MKKAYLAPSLSVYGSLEEITLGIGGTAPDILPLTNVACTTGVISGVTITCAVSRSGH